MSWCFDTLEITLLECFPVKTASLAKYGNSGGFCLFCLAMSLIGSELRGGLSPRTELRRNAADACRQIGRESANRLRLRRLVRRGE